LLYAHFLVGSATGTLTEVTILRVESTGHISFTPDGWVAHFAFHNNIGMVR
jgi:hypothetical protein